MTLTNAQRNQCFSILDELESYSISKMFAQAVDPDRDNVPHYFEIVKSPMDLGTVRKKLMNGEYTSIASWKEDMELIWKNSLLVNSKVSILGCITLEMQSKYQALVKFFSDNSYYDWVNQLYSLKDELNNMNPSKSGLGSSIKKESKSPKPNKSTPTKQVKTKKQQPLTRAEILRLTHDINNLTDEIHILSIFEVFRKCEPQIETDGEILEYDIALLKPSTLWALRETVDNLLGLA